MTHVYEHFPSFIDAVKRIVSWDLETNGIETFKGNIQPTQIGLVVADDSLTTLSDHNLNCKLLDYKIMQPHALLTTRNIDCLSEGQSEFDMLHKHDSIFSQIKNCGYTVSVGFNSDSFDEPILHHARHRELLPPYITSTNGGGKWDLLTTFKLMVNTCKEIDFPLNEKGNFSLKLINLANLFGISVDHAHDALSDSYMVHKLLKVLKSNYPEYYDAGVVHSSKAGTLSMLKYPSDYLFYGQVFGKAFSTPVVYCGQGTNRENANTAAIFDLNFHPEDLISLSEEELEDGGIGKSGSPIKLVPINKTLPIIPIGSLKNPESYFEVSHEELCSRAKIIREDIPFQQKVSNVLSRRFYKKKLSKTSEESIYESFTNNEDIIYAEAFAQADNCKRWGMVNNFQDPRWRDFSRRILISEDYDNSPAEARQWYDNFVHTRLHEKGYGTTVQEALDETDKLLEDASQDDRKLLITLKAFLEKRSLK
jgi:exonuclease I